MYSTVLCISMDQTIRISKLLDPLLTQNKTINFLPADKESFLKRIPTEMTLNSIKFPIVIISQCTRKLREHNINASSRAFVVVLCQRHIFNATGDFEIERVRRPSPAPATLHSK